MPDSSGGLSFASSGPAFREVMRISNEGVFTYPDPEYGPAEAADIFWEYFARRTYVDFPVNGKPASGSRSTAGRSRS